MDRLQESIWQRAQYMDREVPEDLQSLSNHHQFHCAEHEELEDYP
jgi:hypothetical protein